MDMSINTLRLEVRLVRGLGLSYTRVKSASSTGALSLFRLVSLRFSAEVHILTLRRCSGRNLGYTKRDEKRSPTTDECLRFTSGQLQLPQSTHGLRN